ncbi:MAG: hypothetical protein RLY61_941 [Candidatus Parcubacteria bacterium]|jgi:hypothetical protein
MLTEKILETNLNCNQLIIDRLKTLSLAAEINPDFKDPHIHGGYLRNIALGKDPKDCDVTFKGYTQNQPGILESVIEAEKRLGVKNENGWDFENAYATELSSDFYEIILGKFSHHTDYLTMLAMDTSGNLYTGGKKTISDLDRRVFDLRFEGVEIWASYRGKGRSYASCIVGDLTRGLYFGQLLGLNHSTTAAFLTQNFDHFFNSLESEDQKARINFWLKKTNGDTSYKPILDKFGVTVLPIL